MKTVYHYTDAAGLKGMLETGSVWATDHRFLNDRHELTHLRSAVNEMLTREAVNHKVDSVRKLCAEARSYGDIQSTFEMFIFSMSDKRDDLSQWRGYAREGMGFTIGFDAADLERAIEALSFECGFGKVEYNHAKQIDSIKRVIREVDAAVVAAIAASEMEEDDLIDEAARTLDAVVELRAAISKHSAFLSENEWRVAASIRAGDPDGIVQVRTRGERLIPYIVMDLAQGGKLPITSIGVGPGFVGPEDTGAVRKLCAINGYDPEIYAANTPYRRIYGSTTAGRSSRRSP